jgi:hypothetical protein
MVWPSSADEEVPLAYEGLVWLIAAPGDRLHAVVNGW